MSFPLERHPGSIIFVDDDENYLAAVKTIFPPQWSIQTFAHTSEFVSHMTTMMAVIEDMDAYQRGAIDRCRKGGSVAIEVLRFWNAFPERYALPKVVLMDYHMPNHSGLDALEQIKDWHGPKVLLTGVADEALVCRAFNERLIDYYVAKQNAKILALIVSTVKLMLNNHTEISSLQWNAWNMSMRPEQALILRYPEITQALFKFVDDNCEHIVIGDPFGVMALGYAGEVKWLQLETTATLDAAADLLVKSGGTSEDAQSVRAARSLTNARINSALGIADTPSTAANAFQIRIPSINEILFGAVFDLTVGGAPRPEACYTAWQQRQSQRI